MVREKGVTMTIQALNLSEKLVSIEKGALDELRSWIRGRVLAQGDSGYDEARKIWNAMIDRRPALIIECSGTADVIYAVRFAKKHQLLISVRGAGHNIAGRALQDDVLLIDLSHLRTVTVDPDKKTLTASPGATLADVDHEAQAYGLAVPVGINSTTGIAGLTLGGGFGWLSRSLGMTIDNLLSVEVVTVDGERLLCSKDQNSDIFWAMTGGGGNFAIATSFTFKLHPVGPQVMCGPVAFAIEEAESVLSNYRKFCQNAPNELAVWAVMRHAPPFPFLDKAYHGRPVLLLVGMYNGPIEKGKTELMRLRELGKSLGDGVAPTRFTDFEQAFDPLLTPGARNYWKSHNFMKIDDQLIKVLVDYAKKLPNGSSEIFIAQMGGKVNKIAQDATAYPHRNVEFIMNVHTRWEKDGDDKQCIAWARDFYKATEPFATGGVYVNFVSEGDDSIEKAYAQNAGHLAKIKSKYDPKNVLRTNLNVKPSQ